VTRKLLEFGGYAAAVVLVAFGVVALVLGINGHNTVGSNLAQEQIYGSPDMTPQTIAPEVAAAKAAQSKLVASQKAAGVEVTPSPINTPSCSVAGELVDTGSEARCFAQYMRVHTFGATSGLTYAQMGRYAAKPDAPTKATDGLGGTNDPQYAQVDPKTGQPVSNGRRDIWVTYTSLTTALNAAYLADQLSIFGIVVAIALILAGVGFGILAFSAFRGRTSGARSGSRQPVPAGGE
jgi:uncharacterized iron-regulated membrane protein